MLNNFSIILAELCILSIVYCLIKKIKITNQIICIFYYQSITLCLNYKIIIILLLGDLKITPLIKILVLELVQFLFYNIELILCLIILVLNLKFLIFLVFESNKVIDIWLKYVLKIVLLAEVILISKPIFGLIILSIVL